MRFEPRSYALKMGRDTHSWSARGQLHAPILVLTSCFFILNQGKSNKQKNNTAVGFVQLIHIPEAAALVWEHGAAWEQPTPSNSLKLQ